MVINSAYGNGSLSQIVNEIQDSIQMEKTCGGFVTASQLIAQSESCSSNTSQDVFSSENPCVTNQPKIKKFSMKRDSLQQTSVDSYFKKKSSNSERQEKDVVSSSESDGEGESLVICENDLGRQNQDLNTFAGPDVQLLSNHRGFDGPYPKQLPEDTEMDIENERRDEDSEYAKDILEGALLIDRNHDGDSVKKSEVKDPLRKTRVSHFAKESLKDDSLKSACTLFDLWTKQKSGRDDEEVVKEDRRQDLKSEELINNEQSPSVKEKKRKMELLFGDSDDDESIGTSQKARKLEKPVRKAGHDKKGTSKTKKPSTSDVELKRMAELVVRLLMPYYKKRRISSRDLFKALARAFSQFAAKSTKSSGGLCNIDFSELVYYCSLPLFL